MSPYLQKKLQEVYLNFHRGDYKKVRDFFSKSFKQVKNNPETLHQFAQILLDMKQIDLSIQYSEAALKNNDIPEFMNTLGLAYKDKKEYEKARHYFEKSLELKSDFVPAHNNLADVFQDTHDYEESLKCYNHALKNRPDSQYTMAHRGVLYLKMNDPRAALNDFNKVLALSPFDIFCLGHKAIALTELGMVDEERELINFEELIYQNILPTKELNEKIESYIKGHHSITKNPDGVSTTKGLQTMGNLFLDDSKIIQEIKSHVQNEVSQYIKKLPHNNHPHIQSIPKQLDMVAWGVSLEEQGYQAPHIHFGGWVSGVYYVNAPTNQDDPENLGWIRFGQGPKELYKNNKPLEKLICPEDSMIVLFPSFFWHHTIPFKTEKQRVSLAFDGIPIA